ncbi:MAG: twin-arginine translocation signal domain-containing protein, partial [Rhodothermales bacterium]
MSDIDDIKYLSTRRHFLSRSACGFGGAALASLINPMGMLDAFGAPSPGNGPEGPHFAPKAKRVI